MKTTATLTQLPPEGHRTGWRLSMSSLVVALIGLVGGAVLMYPSVTSWFTQLDQSRVIANSVTITRSDTQSNAQQLQLATEYNQALNSGASVDANGRLPIAHGTSSNPSLAYEDVLRDGSTGVMARLQIPSIDLDLPVYHGTSDETLERGLGHLMGTSLPIGGQGIHSVITGHRGLAEAVMLTNLDKVDVGDTFTISSFGEVVSYQVISTQVVEPEQTELLQAVPGRDLVTLVTCTPLGINTQRILVTGERVLPTPAADIANALNPPNIPGFPWWSVVIGAGALLAAGYVWRAGYPPKTRSRRLLMSRS